MYIFYNLDQISNFSIFSNYDFSLFTPFESIMVLIGVNLFYLMFLFFCIVIIYKSVMRLYNALF